MEMTPEHRIYLALFLYTLVVIFATWVIGRAGRLGAQDRHGDLPGGTPAPPERVGSTQSSLPPMTAPPVVLKTSLLIVKCSDPSMWYANKIGEMVPYLGTWPGEGYRSREDAGFINLVKFTDARLVVKGQE